MKWWVKKNGHADGPFSEEDIRKRITLNLIGSLDRVSIDGVKWNYLKDTELWRPSKPQQIAASQSQVVLQEATPPPQPSFSPQFSPLESCEEDPPQILIPKRLQMPQPDFKSHKVNSTIVVAVGLVMSLILLVIGTVVIFSRSSNHEVEKNDVARQPEESPRSGIATSGGDGFVAVRDKIALIECKEGRGTGFLLGMDGKTFLISNEHVIRSGGEIKARLIDGTLLQLGEFSVAEDGRDLARFEVLNCKNAPLKLRNSPPNINEQVTLYGNSLGGGVATESKGFIQGVGPKRIETNAEIVHGNSGSPLVDMKGEVVGVAALMELTDSGKEDWSNSNTRYDGKVRRFAVRLSGTAWKVLKRNEYEAQIRALTEYVTYWNYLVPFLMFDSHNVPDSKLVYNDLCSKAFNSTESGFDEMMKAVSNAYEKRGKSYIRWDERIRGRKEFVRRLQTGIDEKELSEVAAKKALAEYDDKTEKSYEKMKDALKAMILVRKEALTHAQKFLNDQSWDAPQVVNGYDGDLRESVSWYREGCKYFTDLMNQKLKDLNKGINEIEKGDDDDEND